MKPAMRFSRAALIFSTALRLLAADSWRVAGTVLDSQTKAPMGGVRVMLGQGVRRDLDMSVVTRPDGKFAFEVAEGQYRLTVQVHDLFQNFGEVVPGTGLGSAVFTGPGLDASNLTFLWNGPSSISGRIIDDAGDPVEQALVQILQSSVVRGRRIVRTMAFVRTNDLGQYRFGPVNGGTYYLAVSAQPWYSQSGFAAGSGSPAALAFAPVYFPGIQDAKLASPLVVVPGKDVTADFTLTTVPAVKLQITCDAPRGSPKTVALLSEGVEGSQRVQLTQSMPGNSVEVPAVPPGRYTIQVAGSVNQSAFTARKEISVGAADLSVELTVQPPAALSGVVRLRNASDRPPASFVVRLINAETSGATNAAIHSDGSFEFPPLPAGKWYPVVASSGGGYFASEISVQGADFKDGVIDLADGERVVLNMVASGEVGRLSGHVVDRDGAGERPVPAAMVALVSRKENALPDESYLYQTDSDGSFNWTRVRAGDYYLFATDEAPLEYANPAAVRGYLAAALQIHVDANAQRSERIPLIHKPRP